MTAAIDWSGVSDVIAKAEATGALLGVAITAPSGQRFSHHGDRRFIAASTIKTAIMIALFREIDAGTRTIGDLHTLTEADKSTGSGVVMHLHAGLVFTLNDLVYLMMSISDNSATNILIELVGMEQVNAVMRDLVMPHSSLGRLMRGRPVLPDENENWSVPDEFAVMVTALLEHRAASPGSCEAMLAMLEKQQNDRRIARYLPRQDRPRWGSKTGSLPGVVNDAGFVMTASGPVVVSVFCAKVEPLDGEEMIGSVTRAALAAVAGAGPTVM
jgi:beta-lactamase class A